MRLAAGAVAVDLLVATALVVLSASGSSPEPAPIAVTSGPALSGETAVGSAYRLRSARRAGVRRRCRVELFVRRPGDRAFERMYRRCAPARARDELAFAVVTFCDRPEETFVVGQLPPADRFEVRLSNGERYAGEVARRPRSGPRPFVVPAPGAVGTVEVTALDESGREIAHEALDLGGDACANAHGGTLLAVSDG